jgi:hypothetical protein
MDLSLIYDFVSHAGFSVPIAHPQVKAVFSSEYLLVDILHP